MLKYNKYFHFSTPQYIAVQNLRSVRPQHLFDQNYSNNIVTCLIQSKNIIFVETDFSGLFDIGLFNYFDIQKNTICCILIFHNIKVPFDHFNALLLNKSVNLF